MPSAAAFVAGAVAHLAAETAVALSVPKGDLARVSYVHGATLLVFLVAAYMSVQRRSTAPNDFLTVGGYGPWATGLVVVPALYAIHWLWATTHGVPREPFMEQAANYLSAATGGRAALFGVTILLIVPVSEELAFRHFLLGAVPHRTRMIWAVIGTTLTSLAFAITHANYRNFETIALLACLGVAFATARIVTGGLVLPVAMHALAAACALALDRLTYQ